MMFSLLNILKSIPRLWGKLYIRGLHDLLSQVQDFQKRKISTYLHDALEMSEDWKSIANKDVDSNNSSSSANLTESEKYKKLEKNEQLLKKDKSTYRQIAFSIHMGKGDKGYFESIYPTTKIISPSFCENKFENHFLISLDVIKNKLKEINSIITNWNEKLEKNSPNQLDVGKQITEGHFEKTYNHYMLFIRMTLELKATTDMLIKIIDKKIKRHNLFIILAIVLVLVYFFR